MSVADGVLIHPAFRLTDTGKQSQVKTNYIPGGLGQRKRPSSLWTRSSRGSQRSSIAGIFADIFRKGSVASEEAVEDPQSSNQAE